MNYFDIASFIILYPCMMTVGINARTSTCIICIQESGVTANNFPAAGIKSTSASNIIPVKNAATL